MPFVIKPVSLLYAGLCQLSESIPLGACASLGSFEIGPGDDEQGQ